MNFETPLFFIVATAAIGSALLMVTRRNPIMSVLFLIVNFFCLALMYLMLRAQFIAIIQILVYAGAIMVLFLFVIMLLNLGNEEHSAGKTAPQRGIVIVLGCLVLGELIVGNVVRRGEMPVQSALQPAQIGTAEAIGKILFTQYLLPFESTSILLLAAIVGVVVLAKRKIE